MTNDITDLQSTALDSTADAATGMIYRPPPRHHLLLEGRVVFDIAGMLVRRLQPIRKKIDTHPVILLPGYGGSERAMRPLRSHLARHGIHAEDWAQGRNLAGLNIAHTLDDIGPGWDLEPLPRYRREAGVPLLCQRMTEHTRARAKALGDKVTLIGWSLGGTIAREVARDASDCVARVITLGSPVVGGPKYTVGASKLREKGVDIDWIERHVKKRDRRPIVVPVTAIISPTDGIVGYQAMIDEADNGTKHIEMNVTHLGMPVNGKVWNKIVSLLSTDYSVTY